MLEHLFGSKTRLKLLHIFFRSPDRPFYVRELSRLVEVQLNAVRREIANLEEAGIIGRAAAEGAEGDNQGTERSKYYQLQSGFLLVHELKSLLFNAQLLEEKEFIEKIKKKGGTIKLFLLTGLFTNENKIETDILLVGKLKPLIVAKLMRDFEKMLGKSLRYTILTEREFGERRELGDVFLYRLLEAKHSLAVDEYGVG